MGDLKLTSSAFSDGGEIPRQFGYKNGNEEPPLTISGTPEGTKSLALVMDDPDAMGAVGKVWVHWIVWNMDPTIAEIGENLRDDQSLFAEGITDFGKVGYGGPAPPDKRHTYVFKLYALDCKVLPCSGSQITLPEIETAMEGHILEQATLTGTYAP
jgi:hypothetical protein